LNDDKIALAIHRASKAEALRKDEMLNEAFASLEDSYVAAWKSWPAGDTDGRERIWTAVNILGKVKEHLLTVVGGGKMARAELDALHPNKQ
jgi:hypothetical protein